MVNYQNGKIYKIYSNIDDSICYIGSTCKEKLCQRMSQHRNDYIGWCQGKRNKISSYEIFEKFGIENCKIELIESYPCNSKDELNKKEGEFIKQFNCTNRKIEGRTKKEWEITNKPIYYNNNKESIAQKVKEYYHANLDKKKEYARIYREQNKDKITQKRKENYKLKKENIL
jgi:hypothetical protein